MVDRGETSFADLGRSVNPNNSGATANRVYSSFMFAVAILLNLAAGETSAGDRVILQLAPDVVHYNHSPNHAKTSWLIGSEYVRQDGWLAGYAYFNNSFDQKSHYMYGGRTWKLGGEESSYWYLKLSGGVIVGYRKPYEDKIPFNHRGVAPAIVPGIGYQYGRFSLQMNMLGVAGLMFTLGYDISR